MNRIILLLLVVASAGTLAIAGMSRPARAAALELEPAMATGIQLDTSLIGGYAEGSFEAAVRVLDSDLSAEERALLGSHLDDLFGGRLGANALSSPGRLRIAYERARRPDGTTRSIQILGVEVAVGGRLHTLFHFDDGAGAGYYDPYGMPVDEPSWASPVTSTRISSPFAIARMHPILRRVLPHTGVDLAAPRGRQVSAAADGIVITAGSRGGYGLTVELQHPNGYITRYAHLNEIDPSIRPAQIVHGGDLLGKVGMTGNATGPHLHYEVRRRGQPVDPMSIAARTELGGRMQSGPEWANQRRTLTTLLSQTPRMAQASSLRSGGSQSD